MNDLADLDALDYRVLAALLAHPRATTGQIGRAVGTSEATVSRRLTRLLRSRAVQVVGVLDQHNSHRARSVFTRLRCRPGTGEQVALQLAAWPETGSVKLLTGSVDCMAEINFRSNDHLLRLMMDELPRLVGVAAVTSARVIRRFSTPHAWNPGILPHAVVDALRAHRLDHWDERGFTTDDRRLTSLDEQVIEAFRADGRLSWQQLGARCEVMPSTARRHAESLMSRGLLRMRAVVEPSVLGLPVGAFLWLRINSAQLSAAAEILVSHPAVLMIAGTAGDFNLCGEIAVAGDEALYDFLTNTVGQLPGLLHADTTVELRAVKRATIVRPIRADAERRVLDADSSMPDGENTPG